MRLIAFRRSARRPLGTLIQLYAAGAFIAVLAGMAACSAFAPAPARVQSDGGAGGDTITGTVTRVVDGDTFWISSADVRIRVWGLDAPETDQPGGSAATAALTRLISGQRLNCRQRDIDRYGRIVGQCFLADERDITAVMIASGTAEEFCRYSGNHYRTC
jgi:endonuclease YncB( thermonuclease family)